jgi:hypothetical protein
MRANATALALDFEGSLANSFLAELTFGWSFRIDEAIIVDGLAYFNDHLRTGPSLHQDHRIRLWNSDGSTLHATSIITNASTVIASTAVGGEWLLNDITPTILAPGEYVIGGDDPACSSTSDCDDVRFLDLATVDPLITFIEARDNGNTGGFSFPTESRSSRNDGYFGPNFRFTPIPEPGTASLLALGLSGFAISRRGLRASE